MNQSPQLLVYKASAGSGKTFTLATEYIKLLINDPRSYRNILAVTFTNKATGEMKERILSQLYGIWKKDNGSEAYLNKIKEELGLEDNIIRKRAGVALNMMIHDYNRFRVETIDSFFQSVIKNMARELNLGANLNIELDNKSVLGEAVDLMIEQLDRNSIVLKWLLDYIEDKISNDKRWNVAGEIKKFGENIFNESYIEKGKELRKELQDKNCISNYRKKLTAIQAEAQDQLNSFAQQFFDTLESHMLGEKDLKSGSKGICSYFHKLQTNKFSNAIRTITVEKCLDNSNEWVTKTSPKKDEIINLVETELLPILEEAEKYRIKNNIIINSCVLSLKYVNNLQLLSNIDEVMRNLNYENNRFLLADTNALLHKLINKDDPSFVFEKIGTTIKHVMIDEFQDTSKMQWDNFKLLLLEGLSQGSDSLIVGDAKQSIYRWRNGDWRILNNLKDKIDAFPISEKSLEVNRRSSANIINFNNEIFKAACTVLNNDYRSRENKDCDSLLKAYKDVEQKTFKNPGKGFVKVSFLGKKDDVDYIENTLQKLSEEVNNLINKGILLEDIAILVRKNKLIPIIADYFDKNTKYKIVSDEAFRMDASLAISMMINALRVISNKDDKIALAQLAVSYQREVLKREINLNDILMSDLNSFLPLAFTENIKKLSLYPLYKLLEKLYLIFNLKKIDNQDAYLCAFYDSITDYLQNNSSDISSFINAWEDKLCAKTIPSGEIQGIRILSIHKSKGLEYKTVLLPFCDWKMENETNDNVVWCNPTASPFDDLDLLPINYSSSMEESIYKNDYLEEQLQLWVDSLNILYVAFTRAENNLIVWANMDKKGSVSNLLLQSMQLITQSPSDKIEINESNSEDEKDTIYEVGELFIKNNEKKGNVTNKLLIPPTALNIKIKSYENNIDFRQSNKSREFIESSDNEESDKYIQQGQLLHNLFSQIQTSKDINPAIERMVFEGLIASKEEAENITKLTKWAFSNPRVKEWYNGDWKLYNECAIIYKEDDTLYTRRPDRVMMKDDAVVVVDFKFGNKQESHINQVKEYMSLLNKMGYNNVRGFLWYVYNNDIDEIVR